MFVRDEGTGRPLVLVHGFPLDQTMWAGQQPLSREVRLLTPDLCGFGQSAAPSQSTITMRQFADDLGAMLDQLSIADPIVLGGLSMGGYVAWQFWQQHRSRLSLSGLILCDTRAAADPAEVAAGRRQLAERVVREGVAGTVEEMLPRLLAPATLQSAPPFVDQIRRVMVGTSVDAYAAAQRGMAERPDMSALLPEIDLPTLVICGQYDALTPPAEMRAMARALPRALYREIPAAGHLAPCEQPRLVNSAIQEFLRNLDGGSS
jgi:pimeloyl-ACP methyl ester carboxylesterase